MTKQLGKYYLRFAWFPKTLTHSKEKIWWDHYYEAHLDLPILDPVYTIKTMSTTDYIVEALKGNIIDGYDQTDGDAFERMLNAAKSLQTRTNGKLQESDN